MLLKKKWDSREAFAETLKLSQEIKPEKESLNKKTQHSRDYTSIPVDKLHTVKSVREEKLTDVLNQIKKPFGVNTDALKKKRKIIVRRRRGGKSLKKGTRLSHRRTKKRL